MEEHSESNGSVSAMNYFHGATDMKKSFSPKQASFHKEDRVIIIPFHFSPRQPAGVIRFSQKVRYVHFKVLYGYPVSI